MKSHVEALCGINKRTGAAFIPVNGMNSVDISFLLNHSSTPNVAIACIAAPAKMSFSFVSLRAVKKGEELTRKYHEIHQFSEHFRAGRARSRSLSSKAKSPCPKPHPAATAIAPAPAPVAGSKRQRDATAGAGAKELSAAKRAHVQVEALSSSEDATVFGDRREVSSQELRSQRTVVRVGMVAPTTPVEMCCN